MMTSTTRLIERYEGRYEAQEEHHGKDYVWCPGSLLVECECGGKVELNTAETTCRCGADHAALVERELASRRPRDEASRPLDKECEEWRKKQDEYLRSECHDHLEWGALE